MGEICQGGPSQLFLKVESGWDLPSRSRDEKDGINRGQSHLSPTFEPKIGKSRGYPDSPRLKAKNWGGSGLASIYPELPRNFKKSGCPARSQSRFVKKLGWPSRSRPDPILVEILPPWRYLAHSWFWVVKNAASRLSSRPNNAIYNCWSPIEYPIWRVGSFFR